MWYLYTDRDDYSSAMSYNVTFRQTAFTDGEDPDDTALSSPILIDIVNDNTFEGVEYFQAHIVKASDKVRIDQDTVNVTINDESKLFRNVYSPECTRYCQINFNYFQGCELQ